VLPELNMGWEYAWWFPAAYALITISIVGIYGRTFSKRFFRLPQSESIRPRIPVLLGAALLGRVIMIYSIFVPLELNTPWL
jgi:hypothetical protein